VGRDQRLASIGHRAFRRIVIPDQRATHTHYSALGFFDGHCVWEPRADEGPTSRLCLAEVGPIDPPRKHGETSARRKTGAGRSSTAPGLTNCPALDHAQLIAWETGFPFVRNDVRAIDASGLSELPGYTSRRGDRISVAVWVLSVGFCQIDSPTATWMAKSVDAIISWGTADSRRDYFGEVARLLGNSDRPDK